MNVSVIIPVQKEIYLERTIASIKTTVSSLPELVLVFDGESSSKYIIDYPENKLKVIETGRIFGTSYSRHLGILAATHDIICTLDSHMEFYPDSSWLESVEESLKKDPKNITCCKMASLNTLLPDKYNVSSIHTGASIRWTKISPKHFKRPNPHILGTVRSKSASTGPIALAIGACYGLSKKRYLEIGAPMQYGTGWGYDEQTLCLTNWVCGGETVLLEPTVAHISLHNSLADRDNDDAACILTNSLRLLEVLPFSEYQRSTLWDWTFSQKENKPLENLVRQRLKRLPLDAHKYFLSQQKRDITDYLVEWSIDCRETAT